MKVSVLFRQPLVRQPLNRCSGVWLIFAVFLPLSAWADLHHKLEVKLRPEEHAISVVDSITLDGTGGSVEFELHPDMAPEVLTDGVRLEALEANTTPAPDAEGAVTARRYRVLLPVGQFRFTLRYQGRIRHALHPLGEDYARGFNETAGIIDSLGVFLAERSYWYPQVAGERLTFDLSLHLPPGWSGMTQGERLAQEHGETGTREQWRCAHPQQEIYLIAGRFSEYAQTTEGVQAMVLLRQPDAALARPYLDVTADYIRLYSKLIGPYPYAKFALVENFWETGYGMPSFTLLGSQVIRLPFILHSSYPHEILHNWWGNGVYVDYAGGNWSEGLTSYLADHLIKEQQGQGVDYRRGVLQNYADYVRTQQDFPLTAFRSRHSAATEAVGYGKTLMLFHMLRLRLGDAAFIQGLCALYAQYSFRDAGFDDIEAVFSTVSGQPLTAFFDQWVKREGAPQLRLSGVHVRSDGQDTVLTARIEQVQKGAAYVLRVPVAIQLEGREAAWQAVVELEGKQKKLELKLPARPLRLVVDPEFDVFRRLDRNEIPPAISQAMGAGQVTLVLPSKALEPLRAAYAELAATWKAGNPERFSIVADDELTELPADRAVWLFGWSNRFRSRLDATLADYAFSDQGDAVTIAGTPLDHDSHAVVVMARHPANPDQALGWLAADQAAALPGLGRKLPHYGRYSYLAFTGDEPVNALKGQWSVVHSPLSITLVQKPGVTTAAGEMQLAPRTPLVPAPNEFSSSRMQVDLDMLAAPDMRGRGLGTPELDQAATYIADRFREAGLQPGGDDGTFLQTWEQRVVELDRTLTLRNVIAVLPGTDPQRAGESLVIGAHYDHLGLGKYGGQSEDRGLIHPGADDNASGVAVLLELARTLAGRPHPRSIIFVAFTGEETGRLGSRHYVRHTGAYPVEHTIAMVNLDTVGRLGIRPLTVLATGTAEEWEHILRGAGYVTSIPIKTVDDDIGSGDQTSFIAAGVPAVQFFSGANADYHRPSDTLDKLDPAGLVKVAQVLKETVDYLADRPQPLTATAGASVQSAAAPENESARRVSLGTTPDYTWNGAGVRLDGVRTRTPAAQAGLQAGDIIVEVNGTPVNNLPEYAQALKQLQPGEEMVIRYIRNGEEQHTTARVTAR
ncbi:MAG: M20/M25/M40 family metallo-hydrolase [Gammaproteobacteria bacterium]